MTLEEVKELIRKTVRKKDKNGAYQVLYEFLASNWPNQLGIYADGRYKVGYDVGRKYEPGGQPITCVECPGYWKIEHLPNDIKRFLQERIIKRKGKYYDRHTKELLSKNDCIYLFSRDGETELHLLELETALIRAYIRDTYSWKR